MFYRMFGLATLALGMLVGGQPLAAEDSKATTHDGKVVSISGDKLVMTSVEGKEHFHTLARDVKLTLDGKACEAAHLKAGTRIRVTTAGADKQLATEVEGLDKHPDFAARNRHDGKLVSITANKLVMTGNVGTAQHTRILAIDAKITCDGKVCKATDLAPGMRVRVTTDNNVPHDAIHVEALDKNADFART